MKGKTRVVLVGCGGIAGAWWGAIKDDARTSLVGLVDLDEGAARKRREDFALPPTTRIGTSLGEMLADLAPDVVFNCTIPEAHLEVTLTALAHGCHVLSEKPLADSLAHGRRLVEAAAQAGRLFAVMQNRRYQPPIRALRTFLDSGAVGPLTTLTSDFYIGAHFGGFRDRMRHVLLLDMAIHTFDAARFISGADPVSVYCHEWNPRGSWYDHDASAIAIFEMSNGLVYNYRGSWCSEGRNSTWECDWRAIGARGTVTWDGGERFQAEVVAKTGGFRSELEPREVPIGDYNGKTGGHAGNIQEFLHCVRHGAVPETVGSDNLKSLAMVFGAIESAETGRKVKIEV